MITTLKMKTNENNSRGMQTLRIARMALGYIALAIGVTVGGVVIGAVVIAPVVARTRSTPASQWIPAMKAGAATAVQMAGESLLILKALLAAIPPVNQWPRSIWLVIGVVAALVVVAVIANGVRRRMQTGRKALNRPSLTMGATSNSGRHVAVGGSGKTPRAVIALAEAGTQPADIARRTGLPLDAVVLCLSMSALGARQLQPPTA